MSGLQRIQHYLLHFAHLVENSQSLSPLINRLESHKIKFDGYINVSLRGLQAHGIDKSMYYIYRQRKAQIEQEYNAKCMIVIF